jgi:hypothetical protein
VLVAGHSLGGVNALLHGYHLQDVLNKDWTQVGRTGKAISFSGVEGTRVAA